MAGLDCSNNNLTTEDYLKGLLGLDGNGNCALRLVAVPDADASYETCDINNISAVDLLKMLIDVDGSGNCFLRVIQGADSGNNCINCDNNKKNFEDLIIHDVVGLSTDGKPALRIIL